jgi:hypothetical protein
MPIQPCVKNGKQGYKWGKSGTCYTGKNAKQKALAQMRAIYAQGYKENIIKKTYGQQSKTNN